MPYSVEYNGTNAVRQYAFPGLFTVTPDARAAFALFTTRRNPFDNSTAANPTADNALMVPLYKSSLTAPCNLRDHRYSKNEAQAIAAEITDLCPNDAATVDFPKPHSFRVDGIEGFMLSSCPVGYSCNNASDPTEPQILYQLTIPGTSQRALVMSGDRAKPAYADYVNAPAEALGYVFPYIDTDSDGLIDGFERILGTHPWAIDSDCDTLSDATEYPVAEVQGPNLDPAVGLAGCADRSVQVTGVVLSQTASSRDLENTVTLKNNYGPTFGTPTTVTLNWFNEDGSKTSSSLPANWECNSVGLRQEVCTGPTPAIGASIQLIVRTSRTAQSNAAVGTVYAAISNSPDPISMNNTAQWVAPTYVAPSIDAALSYDAVTVPGKSGSFTKTHTFTVSTPRGSFAPSAQLEIYGLTVALESVPAGWSCVPMTEKMHCTTLSMQSAHNAVFSVSIWNSGSILQHHGSALLSGFADPDLGNNQVTNIYF